MKPFNLERALAGDEVVTRNGGIVTNIVHFKDLKSLSCVYAVIDGGVESFTKEGNYFRSGGISAFDLFIKSQTKVIEAWINVYEQGHCMICETEEEANKSKKLHCLKTIKITTEVEI